MVAAVVPAAGEVVSDLGTVFQVAGLVEVRLRVTAALDAEELQGIFENGVVDGRVHVEGCGGVGAYDKEVLALGIERREVGAVEVFLCSGGRVAKFIELVFFKGVERTVDVDAGFYDAPLDEGEVSTARDFLARIGVDDLESRFCWVGHVGVFIVLGAETALVDADRAPVIDVQGVQVSTAMDLVGSVNNRECGLGEVC